jgi:type IV pilus assembly protein PilQ
LTVFPRLARRASLVVFSAFASHPAPAVAAAPATSATTSFTGERIDLELQEAALDDVLRLFSDIGKVNIVKQNDVHASPVTAKFDDVPWDEALYLILHAQRLEMKQDGNVIYIVPGC